MGEPVVVLVVVGRLDLEGLERHAHDALAGRECDVGQQLPRPPVADAREVFGAQHAGRRVDEVDEGAVRPQQARCLVDGVLHHPVELRRLAHGVGRGHRYGLHEGPRIPVVWRWQGWTSAGLRPLLRYAREVVSNGRAGGPATIALAGARRDAAPPRSPACRSNLSACRPICSAPSRTRATPPPPRSRNAPSPTSSPGRDVLAAAQTGTGKTAAFTLPILQRLTPHANTQLLAGPPPGPDARPDPDPRARDAGRRRASRRMAGTSRCAPPWSTAGPDRAADQGAPRRRGDPRRHAGPPARPRQQRTVNLCQVEILVLDEADRMLDMGFIPDVTKIVQLLASRQQTLMFSATFSDDVRAPRRRLPARSRSRRVLAAAAGGRIGPPGGLPGRPRRKRGAARAPHPQARPAAGARLHAHQARRQPARRTAQPRRHPRRGRSTRTGRSPSGRARWTTSRTGASRCSSRPTSRPAAWTSRTCRTSSTTSCRRTRRTTSTASAAPAGPAPRATRSRWSASTRWSCSGRSSGCSRWRSRGRSRRASSPTATREARPITGYRPEHPAPRLCIPARATSAVPCDAGAARRGCRATRRRRRYPPRTGRHVRASGGAVHVEPRVLLVEDDPSIRETTAMGLRAVGFAVERRRRRAGGARRASAPARPGRRRAGRDAAADERPGAVPHHPAESSAVPVLMLTARSDTDDVVLGLEAGADDYMPQAVRDGRARRPRRRARSDARSATEAGARHARRPRHRPGRLHRHPRRGGASPLSNTEFRLLLELAQRPGQVFTRELLLERVWGYDYLGDSRLVDVAVQRLRAKIEADPAARRSWSRSAAPVTRPSADGDPLTDGHPRDPPPCPAGTPARASGHAAPPVPARPWLPPPPRADARGAGRLHRRGPGSRRVRVRGRLAPGPARPGVGRAGAVQHRRAGRRAALRAPHGGRGRADPVSPTRSGSRGDVETLVEFGDGDPFVSGLAFRSARELFSPELVALVAEGRVAYQWLTVG